jgi:hypothetical protein
MAYFAESYSPQVRPKRLNGQAPSLTQTYRNTDWGFSLKMPADFAADPPNAIPMRDANGKLTGQGIVLRNDKGDMVRITVTSDANASPDNTFSTDDLAREAPSVDPAGATPVQLPNGVTGMTFTDGPYPPATTTTDELIFTYRATSMN